MHYFVGSVHYDEGESEAESLTSNIDMSNPIFQLYEAVRGARNSQGQLISEPFLQLPLRKDYPDYYHQIRQPICLHQIKYGLICGCSHEILLLSSINIYFITLLSHTLTVQYRIVQNFCVLLPKHESHYSPQEQDEE